MPRLLQITGVPDQIQAQLDSSYDIVHAELAEIDAAWMAAHGGAIEGIVTGGHLGAPPAVMQGLPKLSIVAINGVGYDKVDTGLAKSLGLRVSNTPDVLTEDVADLAVGLTLALLRRLPQAQAYVRAGEWLKAEMPLASKLSGKRIGIHGLGRIGRAVAKRFAGFTDAISYSDVARQDVPFAYHADPVSLAGACDIFVICAAASAATRRSIGRPVFDALGADGTLVNVARGSIVDEPELVAALVEGRLGGAALDVFEDEPRVPAALLDMPNVIATPHIASATRETRQAMGQLMLDNLAAHFAGRALPTPVV